MTPRRSHSLVAIRGQEFPVTAATYNAVAGKLPAHKPSNAELVTILAGLLDDAFAGTASPVTTITKQRVRMVASQAKHTYRWCSTVDSALYDMGIGMHENGDVEISRVREVALRYGREHGVVGNVLAVLAELGIQ